MDISLDDEMDGIETAKIIGEKFDIPVVYITVHNDEAIVQRAKKSKAFGYLLKPFADSELRITIENSLYKYKMDKKVKESKKNTALYLKILQVLFLL